MDDPLPAILLAGRTGCTSPRGAYHASVLSGPSRNRIELARAGGAAVVLEGRWLRTVSVAFSASERWIAAGGFVGGVTVWETATGAPAADFPDLEAAADRDGALPVAFAQDDAVLVCGGRQLAFISTQEWSRLHAIQQPAAGLSADEASHRLAVYEAINGRFVRWTINMKSYELEGADRLEETRVYRSILRAAS